MSKKLVLCRLDDNSNEVISLDSSEKIIISREFLKIVDKRISRYHGEIHVLDKQIKIKSCHHNPIFYKTEESSQEHILMKPNEATLNPSDKFSLLPNSVFQYEVRIAGNSDGENLAGTSSNAVSTSTGGFRVRDLPEIIDNLEAGMPTSLSQMMNDADTTNDRDRTPSPDLLVPPPGFNAGQSSSPSSSTNNRKRSIDETPDSNEENAKRLKPSSPTAEAASTTVEPVKIKPDPDSTSGDAPPPATNLPVIPPVTIKPDPDAAGSGYGGPVQVKTEKPESNQPNPSLRPSCPFGIRCYRLTPDHRRDFAHPTDSDYRRPDFPPAAAGVPECPWGASCYRRNPDHFRNLQHPPASVYSTQPPPPPPPPVQRPTNPPQIRIMVIQNNDDEEDEGDEDEDVDLDDSDVDADYVAEEDEYFSPESASGEDNNLEE